MAIGTALIATGNRYIDHFSSAIRSITLSRAED